MTIKTQIFPIKEEKEQVEKTINNWLLNSIDKAYEKLEDNSGEEYSPLILFLVISCGIDIMSGFYCGRDLKVKLKPGEVGKQYKLFIKKYMKGYDADMLYTDLRNKIAHSFSLGSVSLGHKKKDIFLHNKIDSQNRRILIFSCLNEDFKKAVENYFIDLEKEVKLQRKFLIRYNSGGIIGRTGVDIKISNLVSIPLSGC